MIKGFDIEKCGSLDWETGKFLGTPDAVTTIKYSKEEFINCKPWKDYPGYQWLLEGTHMIPKIDQDRGRGAQIFTTKEEQIFSKNLKAIEGVLWTLPKKKVPRVIFETGTKDKTESYMAWLKFITANPNRTASWIKQWHLETDKERRVHELRADTRYDSCLRIDRLASQKYDDPHTEIMRGTLHLAFKAGRIPKEVTEDVNIKLKNKGKKNEYLDFNEPSCMGLFTIACDENAQWRTDTKGNPLGINTLYYDVLQIHAFHIGKGSYAAPRSKLSKRLREEENDYRVKNGIKIIKRKQGKKYTDDQIEIGEGFNAPIPSVRKRHSYVNKTILRLIRDFLPLYYKTNRRIQELPIS
jgi:hypothetical protein